MKALVLTLALAACGAPSQAPADRSPGGRLEAAARLVGLVVDPAKASIVGSWALDTDRLCIVPSGGQAMRIGAIVDYGEGQRCAASGSVERTGENLRVAFGDCRFEARFADGRITFPPGLPPACDRYCAGRASLAALTVEQASGSIAEAGMLRAGDHALCAVN